MAFPIVRARTAEDRLPMSTSPQVIRFYSPQAVFLAVSLGTPVAGAVLMSWNCKAFPTEAGRARGVLWFGLLGTLALLAVDVALQNATVHLVACALAGVGMHRWTSAQRRRLPGVEFDSRGSNLSVLVGACVGMACLIVLVLALYGIDQLTSPRAFRRLRFGPDREVFVHQDVAEGEARRLAQALEDIGYWAPQRDGVAVVLREQERPAVHLIVRDGAWNEPEAHREASRLGFQIAERVYEGRPIFISLCDKSWAIRLRVDVPAAPQGPPQ